MHNLVLVCVCVCRGEGGGRGGVEKGMGVYSLANSLFHMKILS